MTTNNNIGLDLNTFTIAAGATAVKVADFRNAIERLERIVHVHFAACVTTTERARCVEMARRVGSELIATTCKRANRGDWDRRERAIEASTGMIVGQIS